MIYKRPLYLCVDTSVRPIYMWTKLVTVDIDALCPAMIQFDCILISYTSIF